MLDTDFVPPGYVTLKDAVDLTGRHCFGSDWTGKEIRRLKIPPPKRPLKRLETAVNELSGVMAIGRIRPLAIAQNGELYSVPVTLWHSDYGRQTFDSGLLPMKLLDALQARNRGTHRRRIVLSESELKSVLAAVDSDKKPKRTGRPRGSGGFAKADRPLLDKMQNMLDNDEVSSVWAAAERVAPEAEGGGSENSRTRRLFERFTKLEK